MVKEKKELEDFHNKLRSNVAFQQLTSKQQSKILKGEWKLQSWKGIAQKAGFSEMLASKEYRYLSGYAHSGSSSILQIRSIEEKEPSVLIGPSMTLVAIVTANFVRGYCEMFPKAKRVLAADAKGSDIVDEWVQIGQKLAM